MDTRLVLSLVFGLGVVGQAFFSLGSKMDKNVFGLILTSLLFSVAGFCPGKRERSYDLPSHVAGSFFLFSLMVATLLKKQLLSKISEHTLLVYNLIFIYLCLKYIPSGGQVRVFFLALLAVPSFAVLVNSLVKIVLPVALEVAFYYWYIVMSVAMLLFKFPVGDFAFLKTTAASPDYLGVFLAGMVFFILVTNSFYIFEMIPIPGKRQSWADRMREFKEHIQIISDKYDDSQMKASETLLLILLQGGALYLNHAKGWFNDGIIVNFSILFIPWLVGLIHQLKFKVKIV